VIALESSLASVYLYPPCSTNSSYVFAGLVLFSGIRVTTRKISHPFHKHPDWVNDNELGDDETIMFWFCWNL